MSLYPFYIPPVNYGGQPVANQPLPSESAETTFRWATVASVNPVSVRLDGDTLPLSVEPDALLDLGGLALGDRVWVQLFGLRGRRVLILGRASGNASGGDFCKAAQTSGFQSLSNDTYTNVTFNSNVIITNADIHSITTNTDRFYCVTPGIHRFVGQVAFNQNSTAGRKAYFNKNGTEEFAGVALQASPSNATVLNFTASILLAEDDYVYMAAYQASGGNLSLEAPTWMEMEWLRSPP
jgi:hypothetical protein